MMKKYFLKGKQLLNKKLEQLQIDTQAVDYVNEQIPNKLKQPLAVLQGNIDLEQTQKYQMYFKMYPTHHLSSFLLEKFKLLIDADTQSPEAILPKPPVLSTQQFFVQKYDTELYNKALLLKQVVQQYQQGYYKANQAIVCLSVIHFHHKRGAQVQFTYPKNKASQSIQNLIVHHSMPDSSHNKNQDYNFFNFQTTVKGKKRMLFGVSYFKQIKVTQQHRQLNKQLTRSYVQKAISVVSYLPLFGYLKLRLHSTVKVFFNDFNNFKLIQDSYKQMQKNLTDTWPQISVNEIYIGSDLRTIINLFGAHDFYEIWRAILNQKRVVVFAHSSSSASSFILSMLTLFPGLSTFGIYSKQISKYMQSLRQYALPLKIFSTDHFMSMSFHIQDFHLLAPFQKNIKGSFFVGTTNRLLKQHNDYGVQLIVNLQNCTIQKRKLPHTTWEAITKREKHFLDDLQEIIQKQKSFGYSSSQDNIRNHFHNFLKDSLAKVIVGVREFKKFIVDCSVYQQVMKKKNRKSSKNLKTNDQGIQLNQQDEGNDDHSDKRSNKSSGKGQNDFPPTIPEEVTSIPFPQLLLSPSFQFFLQFHNQNLPDLIKQKIIPGLLIQNFKYFLRLQQGKFVVYDWFQKKLSFGKGNPKAFQGNEIKFYKHFEGIDEATKQVVVDGQIRHIKSFFVGMLENGKYMKNGFFMDKTQIYEGDFNRGMKQGYGKLTNTLHKYIGCFQQDLYSGQGQLVTSKQIYVGQFKEGLRNGNGKNQSYQKGLNYDGQWLNDKPQGNGVMKNQQNTEIIGVYKNGKVDEEYEVSLRFQDGSIYKGQIKDGKQNGTGFTVDQQGKLRMGQFQNGKLIKQHSEQKYSTRNQDQAEQKQQPEKDNKQQHRTQQPQPSTSVKEQTHNSIDQKKITQNTLNKQTQKEQKGEISNQMQQKGLELSTEI